MARKPKKTQRPDTNTQNVTLDDPANDAPETQSIRRDAVREAAMAVALSMGHDAPDEVDIILEEQNLAPGDRARARYHRRANENLCHAIENDPAFQAALCAAAEDGAQPNSP